MNEIPTDWKPLLSGRRGPRYMRIVEAMEADIGLGKLTAGSRLPPQRELAEQLNLSVGTVSKAYAEAELRGLVAGQVGRGTFVLGRKAPEPSGFVPGRTVNLALNVPPDTGEAGLIAATLGAIAGSEDIAELLRYTPHQGLRDHREAIAGWLGLGNFGTPEQLFITHGAQHAISIAVALLTQPGSIILTENLTYSGIVALAQQMDLRLHGVAMDSHGLLPEALDHAFAQTGARVLFATPTLQTPTGTTMPQARRDEIAEVIRRYDGFLVEDDAYGFLYPTTPCPISTRIPERSFYIASLSKCLSPGLRIGAMAVPDGFRDRCANSVRATGWAATPVMAEVVSRLIRNGELSRQVVLKRGKASARSNIARRVLSGWLHEPAGVPGFHVWLPLPAGRTMIALITQAAQIGITLAPPSVPDRVETTSRGVRLCLGSPATDDQLEDALVALRRILDDVETVSLV